MSLWSAYIKEREGHSVIEEPWGFIEYSIHPPTCAIHSLYVVEDKRNTGLGSLLADRVTSIARESACTHLWSQVWTKALNSTQSLKAILAYGFVVQDAQNGFIIMTKCITEESHG